MTEAQEIERLRNVLPRKTCSVEGCDDRHYAKGFCGNHYKRLRKYGDPLGSHHSFGVVKKYYRDVVLNYEGDECLIWPYSKNSFGYGHMRNGMKMVIVSRRLCEEVNGPPPNPDHQAAHSCGRGNQGCVAKGHLSWKTGSENQADRILHDTHHRGERNPNAKLTEDQAKQIISLEGIQTKTVLAEKYGVSRQVISNIQSGKSWSWVREAQK